MIKQEHSFKRRNDLYYITLLVYVAFAVLYIVVTGTITSESVKFGLKDPVVYIIAAFAAGYAAMIRGAARHHRGRAAVRLTLPRAPHPLRRHRAHRAETRPPQAE